MQDPIGTGTIGGGEHAGRRGDGSEGLFERRG